MKTITIGRLPDNDIVVDNKSVSRHHARITQTDTSTLAIEDLNSKNGTYVNGRKVKGIMSITPKDRIVICTTPVDNWYKTISNKPEIIDAPSSQEIPAQKPIQEDSPAQAPAQVPDPVSVQYNPVLYDFNKNAELLFSSHSQRINQIISDYKESQRFANSPRPAKHYSEELFDVSLEQYQFGCAQITAFLGKIEQTCASLDQEFDADIKRLDNTYQYRLASLHSTKDLSEALQEVEHRKNLYLQLYNQTKQTAISEIYTIIDVFYRQYPPLYPDRYELASANSASWQDLIKKTVDIQSTFYLGENTFPFVIFKETIPLTTRVYLHTLCRGNLQFVYNRRHRMQCFDIANTLLCRILMSLPNGGLNIYMVDLHEMEGTSNVFKDLNKKTFSIISRYEEFLRLLNALSAHMENVIQNLLKGDITCLSDYNKEKTNKEPYQILILKDIPVNYGNEVWPRLAEIMRNGPRTGISTILLLNDEAANKSEETLKGFRLLQNALRETPCETLNLITQETPSQPEHAPHSLSPDTLSPSCTAEIVKKVNRDMEVKTETILHYTDYILPQKEWWTGQSANRIDLPFGISDDMKTTSLQITQESGQNSAVVIGIPGSGKSVFLHTIIASAITHYSPKELQLYLLDFSGVEFNVYARHKLPHARVIAPEAEREFGLSILREVFEEGNRRMTLCRENGVTNIVELKRNNPEIVIPRLLVIIDEFQKIFEVENDIISKDANTKIHAIIQEYRKFGINLILATQKLPAKSIVPYDLIANRVVFKSDPNDFNNLIHWPHSTPQPRLQTGSCIYNNESGAEAANSVTQSFYINATKELESILEQVRQHAIQHPNLNDDHELRVFRSDELPEFTSRILSDRHIRHQDAPREVGVYLGESIAIAPCHVYVPLTKDSNNNILIIGGLPNIAKGIAYHTLLSEVAGHTEKSCNVILMNFMMEDDPMQGMFQTDMYAAISGYSNIQEVNTPDDVRSYLQFVKDEVIDTRKKDPALPVTHLFINIFDFQRGRMFDGTGGRGDMQSECSNLLEYIMKNGPMVGVFTVLQVDNLANLNRLCYGAQNLFCHRIALQMSEQDSDKVVGNSAANKLLVLNRPATHYRGLYYNNINNSTTKFKPYRYGSYSNQ